MRGAHRTWEAKFGRPTLTGAALGPTRQYASCTTDAPPAGASRVKSTARPGGSPWAFTVVLLARATANSNEQPPPFAGSIVARRSCVAKLLMEVDFWCALVDSNHRPPPCEGGALPLSQARTPERGVRPAWPADDAAAESGFYPQRARPGNHLSPPPLPTLSQAGRLAPVSTPPDSPASSPRGVEAIIPAMVSLRPRRAHGNVSPLVAFLLVALAFAAAPRSTLASSAAPHAAAAAPDATAPAPGAAAAASQSVAARLVLALPVAAHSAAAPRSAPAPSAAPRASAPAIAPHSSALTPTSALAPEPRLATPSAPRDVVVLIAYASRTGATEAMAAAVAQGASSVSGTRVVRKKVESITTEELLAADAIVVGTPVHNGGVSVEVKTFLDRWPFGQLQNKVGAAFVAAGATSSGEELTMMNLIASMLIYRFVVVGGEVSEAAFGASAITVEGKLPAAQGKADAAALGKARGLGARVASLTHALVAGGWPRAVTQKP